MPEPQSLPHDPQGVLLPAFPQHGPPRRVPERIPKGPTQVHPNPPAPRELAQTPIPAAEKEHSRQGHRGQPGKLTGFLQERRLVSTSFLAGRASLTLS
ncbi:hypothetical protein A4R35_10210 [Thermogemmatispora tikiterensis]|uniref:Uncharacterized protein n=1 Tax=Thermogemmatispora tikiterensis TaxID=1825093 RepID=A0A328VG16_9CHLR|nr:hypothetical protein A4R35_10210 [Thermogemmatispora tikiterensis]